MVMDCQCHSSRHDTNITYSHQNNNTECFTLRNATAFYHNVKVTSFQIKYACLLVFYMISEESSCLSCLVLSLQIHYKSYEIYIVRQLKDHAESEYKDKQLFTYVCASLSQNCVFIFPHQLTTSTVTTSNSVRKRKIWRKKRQLMGLGRSFPTALCSSLGKQTRKS